MANFDTLREAYDVCKFVLKGSTWNSALEFKPAVIVLVLTAIAHIRDHRLTRHALPIAFSKAHYFRYLEPLLLDEKRWLCRMYVLYSEKMSAC